MRICIYLFVFLGTFISAFSQKTKKSQYDLVKERVSKTFFVKPLDALEDAYILKKIAKTDLEIVTSYKYLGYIYDLSGNSDSARYYFTKELFFAKKNFHKDEIHYQAVINYCNWGINYVDEKVIIKELTEALNIIDQNKFEQQKGLMYMLLGDVLLKDFDFEKAENYFDKSFKLIKGKYIKVDYYMRKAQINNLKSDYVNEKGNLLLALNSLDTKEIFTYPQILNKLGEVSMMIGNYSEAKKYLDESLFYQNKNSFKGMSSETYLNLYKLNKASKVTFEKFYLDKALESNSGDISVLKKIFLEYKEYYAINKNVAKEREYFEKFNRLNDSIFSIEKVKVKADIESRYQLNENKKELALKEKIIQKDINVATREDLIAVYGIGEKLADKILQEKEKLGGFVSMEQFQFMWGISPEAISDLEKRFSVKSQNGIKKIAINDLSQKELAKFPYFNYALAKEIVIYRTMNSGIKNIDDLTKIKGMPNEKIKIIALYLEF